MQVYIVFYKDRVDHNNDEIVGVYQYHRQAESAISDHISHQLRLTSGADESICQRRNYSIISKCMDVDNE